MKHGAINTEMNQGDARIFAERMHEFRRLLELHGPWPLDDQVVLDIGCGHGHDLARLREWGAQGSNLYGVDLSADRIETARRNYPGITFTAGSADQLSFANGHFDLVLMCTLMTSVLVEATAAGIVQEVDRVLKPGGRVIWYDFRYPSPTNRRTRPIGLNEIKEYFKGYRIWGSSTTLLPPLARRLGAFTHTLYPLLRSVPFLRSHYILMLCKP